MAIDRKTAVLQIRVEPELLALFRLAAEEAGFTVSEAFRGFMRTRVDIYEAKHKNVSEPEVVVKDDRLKAYEAKNESRRANRIKKH